MCRPGTLPHRAAGRPQCSRGTGCTAARTRRPAALFRSPPGCRVPVRRPRAGTRPAGPSATRLQLGRPVVLGERPSPLVVPAVDDVRGDLVPQFTPLVDGAVQAELL